jgi:hypothetical protein
VGGNRGFGSVSEVTSYRSLTPQIDLPCLSRLSNPPQDCDMWREDTHIVVSRSPTAEALELSFLHNAKRLWLQLGRSLIYPSNNVP